MIRREITYHCCPRDERGSGLNLYAETAYPQHCWGGISSLLLPTSKRLPGLSHPSAVSMFRPSIDACPPPRVLPNLAKQQSLLRYSATPGRSAKSREKLFTLSITGLLQWTLNRYLRSSPTRDRLNSHGRRSTATQHRTNNHKSTTRLKKFCSLQSGKEDVIK